MADAKDVEIAVLRHQLMVLRRQVTGPGTPTPNAGSAPSETECLDWLLIRDRRHLERVLSVYIEHYNTARPHRSLDLQTPLPASQPAASTGRVELIERVDHLGGLLHEYRHAA